MDAGGYSDRFSEGDAAGRVPCAGARTPHQSVFKGACDDRAIPLGGVHVAELPPLIGA